MITTKETSSLHDAMRRLWAEDVIWTREYIVDAVAGAPEAAQAAAQRLLKNQEDIGNVFVPFYGEEMGGSLTDLLKSHVLVAVDLVNAAIADDEQQFRREESRWNDNAGEIAACLSEANPRWPETDVQDLLSRELSFTKRELDASFENDWECDVEYFDEMFSHILTMADVLCEGLLNQFPDRFDVSPGSADTSSTIDQELSRPGGQVASALVEAERRAAGAEARLTDLEAEADELRRLVGRLEVERADLSRQLEIERAPTAEPEAKAEDDGEAPPAEPEGKAEGSEAPPAAALTPSSVPTIISSPPRVKFRSSFMVTEAEGGAAEAAAEAPGRPWEGEPNAMEIEEIPRTFSLRVTEQELAALTNAVCSWLDNSTGEDPAAETLSAMYQQLTDALEEEEVAQEDSLSVVELEPAKGQLASPTS